MCSFFELSKMENYNQGDLTDILRAGSTSQADTNNINPSPTWQFPSDPISFTSTINHIDHQSNIFGDPFSTIQDPLLNELNMSGSSTSSYYTASTTQHNSTDRGGVGSSSFNRSINLGHKVFEDHDHLKNPCNIFSRIQISQQSPKLPVSPCDSSANLMIPRVASPKGIKAPVMVTSDMINANTAPVQISSPRNLGIKRRKSQAKKVVCIPAPAAANSRSSGEVVPSDLWAWRKYGQKPIKGSPYPRGYYRCSSSKGCSARKQVERSRTDPNMLVITYTSEHNHPWPTQRNALAGSTRAQPSKNNIASSSSKSTSQNTTTTTKEEIKESTSNDTMSPINIGGVSSSSVKEEIDDQDIDHQKQFEMDHEDIDQLQFSEGFGSQINYKPTLPDHHHHHHSNQSEDFFAELGEIETDPLNLLFSQGGYSGGDDQNKESNNKGLDDPFNIFDWSPAEDNSKRGL